jgi:hypothetical protein
MRKWGFVITAFYAVVVIFLLIPVAVYFGIGFDASGWTGFNRHLKDAYGTWFTWLIVAVPVVGEALLLSLRVDISQKRLKPRTHILISSVTSAFFIGVLTFAGVLAVGVMLRGDKFVPDDLAIVAAAISVAWALWAIIFYRMNRSADDAVSRAVTWLLRGSVLELLIAVPAHVVVRRRQDCSAPIATSFGITSGIAIMLLAFGPSVLLLYKKRVEKLSMRASAGK